jgi:hypothetical protein
VAEIVAERLLFGDVLARLRRLALGAPRRTEPECDALRGECDDLVDAEDAAVLRAAEVRLR